ncbi:MAG: Asp23/Gls24 family envelope stress response protein [Bacillota bacterium]
MEKELKNELGKIIIDEEVIAKTAGLAVMECYGLVGMSSRGVQDGLADLLGWDNISKGVAVEIKDEDVHLELNIIVEYGTNIHEVAHNVIERVRYTLEKKVGIDIDTIDVNVRGVRVGDAT